MLLLSRLSVWKRAKPQAGIIIMEFKFTGVRRSSLWVYFAGRFNSSSGWHCILNLTLVAFLFAIYYRNFTLFLNFLLQVIVCHCLIVSWFCFTAKRNLRIGLKKCLDGWHIHTCHCSVALTNDLWTEEAFKNGIIYIWDENGLAESPFSFLEM